MHLVDVHKTFASRTVLQAASFHAPPGEISAVQGHNGAGKTTLIRVMATIVVPDRGSVHVNGFDAIKNPTAVRRSIGLALVNERSLQWRLDVQQNLELWGAVRGFRRRAASRVIDGLLDDVGLQPQRRQRVAELSSGQRHRLVLARALLASPPVLLIDEPLRGLDEHATSLVLKVLARRADEGSAVVVAAPRLDELVHIARTTWQVDGDGGLRKRQPNEAA